ncbi:zinc-dependent metalloprotease [Moheibacter sediminis]|uniref:Por secretion system C-terminal sorting domain-containing protein n=1 Tax=Moheibacter sediminis TaxID=1434700 RepID=A0A1W2AR83_9FLAO|nr:zinc-dependent metalloprotease [Moheibacter sediminis]SMC63193.1 Por secretion system C-terminal sorting domain-containing protein [Moheibacter sediminis]
MRKILLTLTMIVPLLGFSQWSKTNLGASQVKEGKLNIEASSFYSLNEQQLKQNLQNAPERFSNMPGKIISIPTAEGKTEKFQVWEASNFAPALQAKFPEIKSYIGIGVDDPTAYLRFSLSPSKGISSMILKAGKSEFIERYTEDGKYIVFDSKSHRDQGEIPFECSTPETSALANDSQELVNSNRSSAGVFKTFRLAQSVTGEYSAYHGGTLEGAMEAINATMTRVNGVFEKDLAIQLILVDNNEDVVYLNASSDPYTNPSNISTTQGQLQTTLDNVIGAANYDIGHIFHRSGGGGSAGCIGCICTNGSKGRGYTSPGQGGPEGDFFDIDYVAHEMGHQLGANHTFSHNIEGTGVNIEPGSGSTIMGYAGITSYNVQAHSDDYFTYRSVLQVQNNLQNKPCAVNTTLTNQTPVADAGPDYNIPKGTAFVLRGTATDGNGDTLIYNWEQNDNGNNSTTGANSRVSPTKAVGPNFRSHPHTVDPVRYFPKFSYVLADQLTRWQNWESVNTVTRALNFTFTVRDNNVEGGQTATDAMRVNVRDAGPFALTNPVLNQNVDLSTNSMLVEWDVAGTDGGDINTANVRISISNDNGATFTVVSESTPNDGSETVSIPTGTIATSSAQGRVMVEAVDNIYYAVTRPFKFTGTMAVTDLDNSLAVGLYPNPNNGQFYLKANNIAQGNVKTTIFDTSGKAVYNNSTNHAGGALNQSYSVKLPAGVYVVVIETAEGKTTEKLIIK